MRKIHFVALFGFVAGLVLGAGSLAFAQAQRAVATPGQNRMIAVSTDTAGRVLSTTVAEPLTLSNEELSLKVTGQRHGRVIGTLMAKVDGQWVEVQFAPQDSFASR